MMSRFNSTLAPPARTTNLAGGGAFAQDARNELASILLTSFVQDKAYRTADDEMARIRELVAADPLFAAKAAVYARNEFGMRSVSHIVAVEVTRHVKGEEWVKHFIQDVVRRPDDMTEMLSYQAGVYGLHPLPNALKKGMRRAFDKFDDYQLAKYRADGKTLSLIDLVNLVRPIPTERNRTALQKLVAGTLRAEETWEARLSSGEDKATVWRDLLNTNKLGYMALLRNLRNIARDADDQTFSMALAQLTDPERVHKSLVLPFRYFTAYQQLQSDAIGDRQPLLLGALSQAADIAIDNLPDLDGRTKIALDMSGSMSSRKVSGRSDASCMDIGSLFAAALYRRLAGRATLLMFDTKVQQLPLNPADSILTVAQQIRQAAHGGGTMMDLVFDGDNEQYDRVIILSDMQSWVNGTFCAEETYRYHWGRSSVPSDPSNDALNRYRKRTGANPSVFALDLHGYGSMQFPAGKCCQIAGWSEKVFDLMAQLEKDKGAMVREIDSVAFSL